MQIIQMGKHLRILLADDDIDDRYFFSKALKQISIQTDLITVQDGAELLDFLEKSKGELPDFIFLDLNMPRKNGNECLIEIKKNPNTKHIPVIIYSTSLHDEVADILYNTGAHYYLQKCNFAELPGAILKILQVLQENPEKPPREKFIVNSLVV